MLRLPRNYQFFFNFEILKKLSILRFSRNYQFFFSILRFSRNCQIFSILRFSRNYQKIFFSILKLSKEQHFCKVLLFNFRNFQGIRSDTQFYNSGIRTKGQKPNSPYSSRDLRNQKSRTIQIELKLNIVQIVSAVKGPVGPC